MRVLATTAWYPNRKVAGDGVFIQKHARAIARLNDVAVLMVQTDEAKRDYSIEIEARDASGDLPEGSKGSLYEVLVYVPKTWREIPVITGLVRMFWLLAGYLWGYRHIRRRYWAGQHAEVCHVNVLTRAAGLPWLLRRLRRIPYIITEHWSRYARQGAYPKSGMQLRLGRIFVRDASYVCPVSLNLEQSMKQWQLVNPHYTRVGNVVDTDTFAPCDAAEDSSAVSSTSIAAGHPVTRFVHVSWMRDDVKNISGMLRVLSRLSQVRTDFHLRLIGEGNDKSMLMDLSHRLGLDSLVTFVDARQGAALAQELCASDALLMFSYHENQPVSVLEALACGLPVIATSVGSLPSMLAHNRGVTVTPGNEDELYAVIDGFLTLRAAMAPQQHADYALAQQRREYVVSRHSPEVIGRQFDALYQAARASIG